jgi:GDP-D-mannose dehydratase
MTLSFPNRSRSYDATRRAVRFWGHDSAMEASFFVTEDALKQIEPTARLEEVSLLGAFDANRDLIYATATKVYARGRKGSYELIGSDF